MPKENMKFANIETTDYVRSPTVIDVSMGEFAASDFYPIHSDSFATCMGVVIGAVDGFGVLLAHLDPLTDDSKGGFYRTSLAHMIGRLLAVARATRCDVCFFKDGFGALDKFDLSVFVATRFGTAVRNVYIGTDKRGIRYDEAIVMPSAFYSATVCLKRSGGT